MSKVIREPIHIQTADEMFEKLEYEKDIDCLNIIRYAKHDFERDYYIRFYTDIKRFDSNYIYENNIFPCELNMQELKAINKKCEELGWLDEQMYK